MNQSQARLRSETLTWTWERHITQPQTTYLASWKRSKYKWKHNIHTTAHQHFYIDRISWKNVKNLFAESSFGLLKCYKQNQIVFFVLFLFYYTNNGTYDNRKWFSAKISSTGTCHLSKHLKKKQSLLHFSRYLSCLFHVQTDRTGRKCTWRMNRFLKVDLDAILSIKFSHFDLIWSPIFGKNTAVSSTQ